MEYSVNDLIRILLKRWYIILLSMALISAAAVFLSQRSYEAAVENYEKLTSETVQAPIDASILRQGYRLTFALSDTMQRELDAYLSDAAPDSFGRADTEALKALFLENQKKALPELATDPSLMQYVQLLRDAMGLIAPSADAASDTARPLSLSEYFSVNISEQNIVELEICGLTRAAANELAELYISCLTELLNSSQIITVSAELASLDFTHGPTQHSTFVQIAQTVLREPPAPPRMVKTIGTAAAYSFVLSCFLILAFTFVRDSRRQGRRN